ncbi:MAG: DUF1566 domain-containing protein [Deltaproteobacteria bacterium]|nr:DUF1566 domain-containing protein [Deltaproteobacteria bacterium]
MTNELLLETDQTGCFDESGRAINCHNSGQDGAVKQDRRIEGPDRFRVTGDIVQDNLTGLFWHINANLPEFPLTWKEAFEFIQEMNTFRLSGINEWRLPARKELFSLVSHQFVNPSLPKSHPFINVFNGYYWTRTESARLLNQAWYVHLGGGKVYRGMKHGSYMVWAVSGQFADHHFMENRFIAHGDSLYDRITCRYWYAGDKLNDGAITWKDAIRAVEKLNATREVGHGPWRLPNIRELDSLVDDRNHSPAFADGFFINKEQDGYWSSTTSLYEPRYAWVLYALDGAIGVGYKPNVDFYVLAVRG